MYKNNKDEEKKELTLYQEIEELQKQGLSKENYYMEKGDIYQLGLERVLIKMEKRNRY